MTDNERLIRERIAKLQQLQDELDAETARMELMRRHYDRLDAHLVDEVLH